MIFFLVNNSYQYYDAKLHLLDISAQNISLIVVPHTINETEISGFHAVFKYPRNSKLGLFSLAVNHIYQRRRVEREIRPNSDDVLFFYTEYDFLNQHIVSHFKRYGARTYLIEDGGMGTYVPFRMLDSEELSKREKLNQWFLRKILGLHTLRMHKLNGYMFYWMADKWIDGVCLYRFVPILRKIRTILLKRTVSLPKINTTSSTVLFLNEPLYSGYQSANDYFSGLRIIMQCLSTRFEKVYFKFHPRESIVWRKRIQREVLENFPALYVIEENKAIEDVVDIYSPSICASYFSSGLLNLLDRGIEPLYLYHLIPDLRSKRICLEVTAVLQELGYNFISDFSTVDSGYQSGLKNKCDRDMPLTINEIVKMR